MEFLSLPRPTPSSSTTRVEATTAIPREAPRKGKSSSTIHRVQSGDAVQLNTRDPKYLPYLATVKRAILLAWRYPDPALRRRLQGKLALAFTVLESGDLLKARLIRSSGFALLDDEALRSVYAAAPFSPLPSEMGNHLTVTASFEYVDNRHEYHLAARPLTNPRAGPRRAFTSPDSS